MCRCRIGHPHDPLIRIAIAGRISYCTEISRLSDSDVMVIALQIGRVKDIMALHNNFIEFKAWMAGKMTERINVSAKVQRYSSEVSVAFKACLQTRISPALLFHLYSGAGNCSNTTQVRETEGLYAG